VFSLLGRALPNILFGFVMWSFSLVEYFSVTKSSLKTNYLVKSLCYFKPTEMQVFSLPLLIATTNLYILPYCYEWYIDVLYAHNRRHADIP